MAGCCSPGGYDAFFSERQARRDARRYRRRGLDRTARRLVRYLTERGVAGATVLEIGGGVGAVQVELLGAGAARATSVELSSGYEGEAVALLSERNLEARVDRRVVDFAAMPDAIDAADVVVLHRVVCCYPDVDRLVGSAAAHARRRLVLSFPSDNAVSRLVARLVNATCAVRRLHFRVYIHPRAAILAAARREGLAPAELGRSGIWRYAALERSSS
jgi:magnesium-protoporphyrin O-methyltransferase